MAQPELILSKLIQARSSEDVEKALESHCRGLNWTPFNSDMGNKSQIKYANDPVRALVERITNGFDAVIERTLGERGVNGDTLKSPLEAVNTLFPTHDERDNRVFIEIDHQQGMSRSQEPIGRSSRASRR